MQAPYDGSWPVRQLMVNARLRQRRCELGLTQKQVVRRLARSGLATTNRVLSSLEHGAGVDVTKLPALAGALECTVTYLVGLTDSPQRWEPDHRVDRGTPARPVPDMRPTPRAERSVAGSLILGADIPDRGSRLGTGGRRIGP